MSTRERYKAEIEALLDGGHSVSDVLAYIFQAALLCQACGDKVRDTVAKPAGFDPDNESTWDSDDYPKGPYPDGGGESDSPQHCDHCGEFLENPLTGDGAAYVLEKLRPYISGDDIELGNCLRVKYWHDRIVDDIGPDSPLAQWAMRYGENYSDSDLFKESYNV